MAGVGFFWNNCLASRPKTLKKGNPGWPGTEVGVMLRTVLLSGVWEGKSAKTVSWVALLGPPLNWLAENWFVATCGAGAPGSSLPAVLAGSGFCPAVGNNSDI